MSVLSADLEPVDLVILPPVRDLGDGFHVRRALPSAQRRMVGPFIFFDQMGEAVFRSGEGLDVRPHPHIGLATLTYLLEGEILHRDSLGSVQPIRPGEVNWMTAGRGIVHSERTSPEVRATGGALFGLQTWIALPRHAEETAPGFAHHKADTIPSIEDAGTKLTLVAGTSDGLVSPVNTFSDMLYADVAMEGGARYQLRAEHVERAIYVVTGEVEVVGQPGSFPAGELVIFKPGAEIVLRAIGERVSCSSVASRFPRRGISSGISCRPTRGESSRRKPTGRRDALRRCRKIMNLSRFPNSHGGTK